MMTVTGVIRELGAVALVLLAVLVVLAPLSPSPTFAATWHVLADGAGDAPTIQAGIDSAASGDTVLVGPGTYYENLQTHEKMLTLLSTDGPEATMIDGNHLGAVITITARAHLEGFTIQHGQSDSGGGVIVDALSGITDGVEIIANVITENRAGYQVDSGNGGGIHAIFATATVVRDNMISYNYAGDSGGGILVNLETFIQNNIIMGNGCHVGGGGIQGSSEVEIVGNLITENWSDSFGGGIDGSASVIKNNTIVKNYVNNSFPQGAGIQSPGGLVEGNIIALNHGPDGASNGIGISCGSSSSQVKCNDVWGNDIDFELYGGCDTTGLGNFSIDPLFCDADGGGYSLDAHSPCAPDRSNGCGLVGAYPVACNTVPVFPVTWGRLKAKYR